MAQKSFSIQVGGNQGVRSAGGLIDAGFSSSDANEGGFTVQMGGNNSDSSDFDSSNVQVSFGGEPSSKPKQSNSVSFGGAVSFGGEVSSSSQPKFVTSSNSPTASKTISFQTKPQMVSSAVGGEDSDDPFDRPPKFAFTPGDDDERPNEVMISCNLDAEERMETREMGTSTIPDLNSNVRPADERDVNQNNPDMLDILEKELMRGMGASAKDIQKQMMVAAKKMDSEEFKENAPINNNSSTAFKGHQSTRMMPEIQETFEVTTPYGDKEIFDLKHDDLSKGPQMPKLVTQKKVSEPVVPVKINEEVKQLKEDHTEETKEKKGKKGKKQDQKKSAWKSNWQEKGEEESSQSQREDQRIIQKESPSFINYYKHLQIVPPEEWKTFYQKLQTPLDISFRINEIDPNSEITRQELKKYIERIEAIPSLADKVPTPVLWFPKTETAYAFNELPRAELRQNPQLQNFHKFIVNETENGRLFRQEKVSMVPVTLMQIRPGDHCLDMCAAPGSKTIQILEQLNKGKTDKVDTQGFVMANDQDAKRAYMLCHQTRRLNVPGLFIVNRDARKIPNLKQGENMRNFKFDRILCDVPCSGDGTLRKNIGLWKTFHAMLGHSLHSLQLEILIKGLSMVRQYGRVVYSTCSFNPLENEAVVQAALTKLKGKVKLVDVNKECSPFLKRRKGMLRWQVYHKAKGTHHPAAWYNSYDQVPEQRRDKIKQTMFNSTYTEHNNTVANVHELMSDPLNLSYCMRFLPHDDNQGGFFCAVFERLTEDDSGFIQDDSMKMDPWINEMVKQKPVLDELEDFSRWFEAEYKKRCDDEKIPEEEREQLNLTKDILMAKKKEKDADKNLGIECGNLGKALKDQLEKLEQDFPYVNLLKTNPELWFELIEFFGIDFSFPQDYLYRYQGSNCKRIVLLNKGLHQLMQCKKKFKLEVINLGLKLFEKNRDSCKVEGSSYRLLQEGLEFLMPYMDDRRVVDVDSGELFDKICDSERNMLGYDKLIEIKGGKMIKQRVEEMEKGSAVLRFPSVARPGEKLVCTIWLGVNNMSMMLNKEEINGIRFLLKSQS